ncbi:MAG: DMT family transporter [Proteobacteria bacterium]|nr:DMT family transporter [Pseudomonadota bacterium]
MSIRPVTVFGPWAAGVLAIVIWGATPAATKYAVAEVDPLAVGMLRTALAGLAVAPALLLLRLPLPRDRAGWRLLLISTASGFIGFPLLFSLALAHTSTAHAALVLALAPVLTGVVGAVVERRRPGRWWWGGVAVASAGAAALILLRGQGSGEATLYGDLLALAACFAVAGGYVAGSRLSPSIGTWSVTAWGALLGCAVAVPIVVAQFAIGGWPDAGLTAWTAIGWLVLFSSLLAYVAWYWALAGGGVARISTLQFLQPAVTLLLAVVLFAETMTPAFLLSGAVILIGVAMARRG